MATGPRSLHRRTVLLAAPALLTMPSVVAAATATPRQTEGPFYPRIIPDDSDADLTRFGDRIPKGEVIEMAGQVRDLTGTPAAGATVEIWHCDPAGVYPHVGRNNGGLADPDFQGFGAVRTGGDGAYFFRTIRPGIYPGRVRHIHVKVRRQGAPTLTTQMYFPEEDNSGDVLLSRVSDSSTLIARRIDGPPLRYEFDIYVT